MGNTAAPAKSYTRQRSSSPRRQFVYAPEEIEEFEEVTRPQVQVRATRKASAPRKQSALPRDPSTGRYLPRGQRAASPRRSQKAAAPRTQKRQVAASPRRRVEVQVIASPRRAEVEFEPEVRVSKPRRARRVEAEEPRQVQFVDEPPRQQVLRSSYTRSEMEVDEPQVRTRPQGTRTRSASPSRRQEVEAPMTRREYASPSLASRDNQVVIGPSTTRRMKRMATTEVDADVPEAPTSPAPPVERLSVSAPKTDPGQVLFSYLNAA